MGTLIPTTSITTITFITGTTFTMDTTIRPMLLWPLRPFLEGHPRAQCPENSLQLEVLMALCRLPLLLLYHLAAYLRPGCRTSVLQVLQAA